MEASLQFSPEDWQRVGASTAAWWAGELERPLVYLAVTDPVPGPRPYAFLANWGPQPSADEVVDRYVPTLAATRHYADAFPWLWVNFGPGIMAGFLGGEVHSVVEPSETVWFGPPPGAPAEAPLGPMRLESDYSNPWWLRIRDISAALVERYDGALAVGHTDLGGNLDILASLRGTQRLLLDLVDSAQEVEALCARVTALWLEYYDRLDRIIRPRCGGTSCWTPLFSCGTTYMLQCDFSYMISPAMFERFVMPDLVACCNHLEHAFYHLDGRGEIPHLDMLLSIPRLRGVQWIPGDGQPTADRWPQLLARIRAGGKLCQIFVTPEGALRVVRTVGGRGFLFVVSGSPSEFPDREHVQAFLEELRSSDVSRGQRPRAGTA